MVRHIGPAKEARLSALSAWFIDRSGRDTREVDIGIRTGGITRDSYVVFPRRLHADGLSGVIPLDLGGKPADLGVATPGLALSTNFVRLRPREPVATHAQATAEFYFVLRGQGRSRTGDQVVEWQPGDCFLLPSGRTTVHAAPEDSALLWVHDGPWLREIGVAAPRPNCVSAGVRCEGRNVSSTDEPSDSRTATLGLINRLPANLARERSVALRSMVDVLPGAHARRPCFTRSTTLHLVLDCPPGCSTRFGKRLDRRGCIIEPVCVDWEPSLVWVNAPDTWLAHVNNSKSEACLMLLEIPDLQTAVNALTLEACWPPSLTHFNYKATGLC